MGFVGNQEEEVIHTMSDPKEITKITAGRDIVQITDVYVGAFYIEDTEGETIMIANKFELDINGIPYGRPQATVEHNLSAVPGLIEFCKATVEGLALDGEKATFRILHFSKGGMEEIDPDTFSGMRWYAPMPGHTL